MDSAHEEQIWRFQAIDPSSVQGLPADPLKAHCGGMLRVPGERLVWHYDIPFIVLEHGISLTFKGITYGYEHGNFTRLECLWNDNDRTLSLKVKSTPKNSAVHRVLVIESVGTAGSKTVTLDGHPLGVKF